MKIAVEGCAHGELDKIYETVQFLQEENNIKLDLLIICGDFQAVRNQSDLVCMACPNKFKKLNTFYKYYSGEKKAPILTIFVGGNHEASNYMAELPYGGWVCPNIYYMGYANVINIGNLRIGGLSGIYKGQDYLKGHFECLPFDESSKRSIYHIRNVDVYRLKQISEPLDVFISHDWPRGVYHHGNVKSLLKRKPFLKADIEKNTLGSRPTEELLHKLKPRYWFAAHLHCKFSALIPHENANTNQPSVTKFLALDKCLPRRTFLQILDIGEELKGPLEIKYDSEWLCILQSTDHLLNTLNVTSYMPGPGGSEQWDFQVSESDKMKLSDMLNSDFVIPKSFEITAPVHNPLKPETDVKLYINSQTVQFCKKFNVRDPITIITSGKSDGSVIIREFANESEMNVTTYSQSSLNPDEISLNDESDNSDDISKQSLENSDLSELSNKDIQYNSSKERKTVPEESLPDNEHNSCFFIDKEGSKTDSVLTTPTLKQRLQMHLQYYTTPQNSVEKLNFPEIKIDQGAEKRLCKEADSSPFASKCNKKFKRRNQTIYGDNCDDDDDKNV